MTKHLFNYFIRNSLSSTYLDYNMVYRNVQQSCIIFFRKQKLILVELNNQELKIKTDSI